MHTSDVMSCCRFKREGDHVVNSYKAFHNSSWKDLSSFFKKLPNGTPYLPTLRKPAPVQPDFSNKLDIERLSEDINHWKTLFTNPEETHDWWVKYLDGMKKARDNPAETRKYYTPDLQIWQLAKIPSQPTAPAQDDDPAIPPELQQMMDEETVEHTVCFYKGHSQKC